MEQTPQYYIDEPHRLDEIDYEDLLLNMEEDPVNTRWVFLTLLKQKYSFGRVDDELIHHLITIENNKNKLQELLKVIQKLPTKASLIDLNSSESSEQTDANIPPPNNGEEGVTTFPVSDPSQEQTPDKSSETRAVSPSEQDKEEPSDRIPAESSEAAERSPALEESNTWSGEEDTDHAEEVSPEPEDSFAIWLQKREVLPGTARELRPRKKGVKRKKLGKAKMSKAEKQAAKSVEENKELVSETLANLYVQQELYDKAIEMYGKLKLKFPNKSGYFADKIDQIQKLNT